VTLAPEVLDLIQHGPRVTVAVGHHPASAKQKYGLRGETAPSKSVPFLVDTGSPHNILDKKILDDLEIEPTGAFMYIATPAGVVPECPTHRVELRLMLDDGVSPLSTTIVGLPAGDLLGGRFSGILGRSALQKIRFVYDGAAGTFDIQIASR
jgi:hypothetical protein